MATVIIPRGRSGRRRNAVRRPRRLPHRDRAGSLNIAVRKHGNASVVTLSGELDMATAPRLAEALAHLRGNCDQLTLQLSHLRFCDCTGLSVFIAIHQHQRARGGSLLLTSPQPQLRRLLTLTGLDRHLHIHPDPQNRNRHAHPHPHPHP